jgi:chromosomal replication initiation ATPase DnaA
MNTTEERKPCPKSVANIIWRCSRYFGANFEDVLKSNTKAEHIDHMARMAAWTHLTAQGMSNGQVGKAFCGRTHQAIRNGVRKALFRDLLQPHEALMKSLPGVIWNIQSCHLRRAADQHERH